MNLKRIERGWAGHFCCGIRCQWHRNTLVLDEETGKGIVVSSVGQLPDDLNKGKYIEIGAYRYYETMMFVAEERDGYMEANVRKTIYSPDGMAWCVNDYPEEKTDLQAEKIHENHVEYVMKEFARLVETKGWDE